jgi:hypothetical protein
MCSRASTSGNPALAKIRRGKKLRRKCTELPGLSGKTTVGLSEFASKADDFRQSTLQGAGLGLTESRKLTFGDQMLDLDSIFAPQGNGVTRASEASRVEVTESDETETLADAIELMVRRLRERGQPIREIVLRVVSDETPRHGEPRELSEILPPADWLTPHQHRVWLARTEFNRKHRRLDQRAAEQEAIAELVITGKLYDHR